MAIPENATLKLTPFQVSIPEESLTELKTLLKVAKMPPNTYEGTHAGFGLTHQWIKEAKAYWETEFNWYALNLHSYELMKITMYHKEKT
jgi:microsomal epoxide hydrolase